MGTNPINHTMLAEILRASSEEENTEVIGKVFEEVPDIPITKLIGVSKQLESSIVGSNKFNEVFKADKYTIATTSPNNYIYLYKKNKGALSLYDGKGSAIRIVCAAYFIKDSNYCKIIIASRLDTDHIDDPTTPENQQGGISDLEKVMKKSMETTIEKFIKNSNNSIRKILDENDLDTEFKEKMTETLKTSSYTGEAKGKFAKDSIVYEELSLGDSEFDEKKIINQIYKFNVDFSVIFVESTDTIYYTRRPNWQNYKYKQNKNEHVGNYLQEKAPMPDGVTAPVTHDTVAQDAHANIGATHVSISGLTHSDNAADEPGETNRLKVMRVGDNLILPSLPTGEPKKNEDVNQMTDDLLGIDTAQDALAAPAAVNEAKDAAGEAAAPEAVVPEPDAGIPAGTPAGEAAAQDAAPPAIPQAIQPAAVNEAKDAAAGLGSGSTRPASHLVMGENGGVEPSVGGGKKRKLTRKQLNIMTLTELKQLHKVNKIKMNNNRTIKALINNYIKNYKKN